MEAINNAQEVEPGKLAIEDLKNRLSLSRDNFSNQRHLAIDPKATGQSQLAHRDASVGGYFCRYLASLKLHPRWRLWIFGLVAIFGCFPSIAQNATLVWQASPSPNIAGYVVFYGTVSGTYTYSNSLGLATNETFTNLQSGTTYYFAVSDTNSSGLQSVLSSEVSYTIPPANPVISWSDPANIVYGTPLDTNQLNASANVAGSFAYNPPIGTVLPVGSAQLITAIFTPLNTTNYNPATNTVTVNVLQAPVTISGNNVGKTYGSALPTLTATYSGFVNGDTVASLTTAPSLTTTATASSPVGTYSITAGGAVDPNYAISYVSGALTVSPAMLTITANNQSKAYGGTLPTLTATYSGFVNGDTTVSLATPPSISTSATTSGPVGTYPITAGGAVDPNYAISYISGALTVSPATLTITANNQSMAYGAALPTLTAAYSGFVNGETVANLTTPPTMTTTATASSPVGTYSITAGGAADPNYAISYVNGTLTVTEGVQLVTWSNPASIVYGAALNSNQLNATASVPGSFAYTPSNGAVLNAGTNTLSVTFTPTDTVDYSNAVLAVNLVVSPASLTVSASSASRTYGQTNPVFGGTISGLQNGDDITATYSCTASGGSSVGTYAIVPSLVDPENRFTNYIIDLNNGTFSITQVPLTITANNQSKAYGAALPNFTASFTGLVNGDTVSSLTTPPSLSTTATGNSPVGSYPVTVGGAADPNYSISYINGALVVSPSTLTITANNQSMAYGSTLPTLTASFSGFVNGDNVGSLTSLPNLTTTATRGSPVGTYPITAAGAADPNYAFSYVNGTLTVTEGVQLVTWNNPESIIYGTALDSNQLNATASVPGSFIYTPSNGAVLNAGTNTLSVTFTPTDTVDYSNAVLAVDLVVSPAALTVSAFSASGTYGQTNPVFGGTISGLQNGDDITAIYGGAASGGSLVGTYAIVPSLVDPENRLTNYVVTLNNGTLSVLQATPQIVWTNSPPITYGTVLSSNQLNAVANAPGYDQSQLQVKSLDIGFGEGIPGTFAYDPTNGAILNTGTNTLSVTFTPTDGMDYSSVTSTMSLVILPAALTVSAFDVSRYYSQTNPVFGGTIVGLENGDNISATYSCIASTSSPVGTYAIVPILVDPEDRQTNYIVNLVNGTLSVTQSPAPPLITLTSATEIRLQFSTVPSTTYGLQASSDLKIWNNISTFTDESTNGIFQYVEPVTNNAPARFYRLVSQ